MAKKKNKKRNRLSKEEVRKKSASPQTGSGNWYNLPDGIETWEPEKKGRYKIDILPYETTDENHPNEIPAGIVWYMRPFKVHHGLGTDKKSVVCPTSIGEKCPVCEEIARLSKDYDKNEDIIKSLRPQRWVAFNIIDPDDKDGVCIFAMSVGKFFNTLEQELDEADDEDLANFFDINEDGKTLKVRFSKASFGGHDYLEATKIDFLSRKPMDEDEVFDKVVNLDEMFVVIDYDKLKDLFMQVEDPEDDDEEEDEKPSKKSKKEKKSSKKKSKKDEEDDDEDDDWDEDEEDPDDDDDSEEDDDDTDDDEEEDEEEEEEKPAKKKKKKKSPPKKEEEDDDDDDDWDDDDDDWDEEEEEEEKPAKKKKSKKKKK